MTTSILVLGAGELGEAILESLRQAPAFAITLLIRPSSADKYSHYQSEGIHLLHGDISSSTAGELTTLFQPFHTIIGCTGFAGGPGTQQKLAAAVLEAGVQRYIPWQWGVDYDVIGRGSAQDTFDEQLDVRDMLRSQSRTEWIIVSTGMFMSFLFESFFGVVDLTDKKKAVVRALGCWDNSVTVTTVEDIGKLTAEILLADPPIKYEVVFVAGDVVSYKRLADVVEAALGQPVQREVRTVAALKDELRSDAADPLKKYRVLFAEGRGVSWGMEKTFNARKGLKVTSVDEYARRLLVGSA